MEGEGEGEGGEGEGKGGKEGRKGGMHRSLRTYFVSQLWTKKPRGKALYM